jgi:RNase H-fold protein (predicted Holliday junction resolvase)
MKVLTKPSKVASALDWKKVSGSTVLSLDIHKDRIGIAIASHPSYGEKCHTLEPIRFKKNYVSIDDECMDRLSRVIQENKVCAMVVAWPLQKETGKMGASCGRVLYALEELIEKSQNLLTPSRPLCLWDSEHRIPRQLQDPEQSIDEFGRCASYCKTSKKEEYRASEEQYYQDENMVAAQVWEDFCKVHWPELYYKVEDDEIEEVKASRYRPTMKMNGTSWRGKEKQPHSNIMAVSDVADRKRSLVQAAR